MTLLVEETLMIDAGSALSGLDPLRAGSIKNVILTHAHLDHLRELGFLPFHRDPDTDGVLSIWGTAGVIEAVRTAVFNDSFWIDFENPRPPRRPGIRYELLKADSPRKIGGVLLEAVPTSHSRHETSGFILQGDDARVVYAVDSGPTERIWEIAGRGGAVDGVFYDVSLPNRYSRTEEGHLTPSKLMEEVEKLQPRSPRIIATHLKPEFRDETVDELGNLPFAVEIPRAGDVLEFRGRGGTHTPWIISSGGT
jgi:3',5'-cyclic-nucleotide phosphodiesterase